MLFGRALGGGRQRRDFTINSGVQYFVAFRVELASELAHARCRVEPVGELAAITGRDSVGQPVVALSPLDRGFDPTVKLVCRQVGGGSGVFNASRSPSSSRLAARASESSWSPPIRPEAAPSVNKSNSTAASTRWASRRAVPERTDRARPCNNSTDEPGSTCRPTNPTRVTNPPKADWAMRAASTNGSRSRTPTEPSRHTERNTDGIVSSHSTASSGNI